MQKPSSEVCVYDLVQYDRASGKRVVIPKPVVGRDPAHKELEKLRRANRDPTVYYALEPNRRDVAVPEKPRDLLKHSFGRG